MLKIIILKVKNLDTADWLNKEDNDFPLHTSLKVKISIMD